MFELASLLLLLQDMLQEIEEKVLALSELSVHSESLLLQGRKQTRDEAEHLTGKLRTLKGGLLELQKMLQDKQSNIQVKLIHSKSNTELKSCDIFIFLSVCSFRLKCCFTPTNYL